LIEDFLRLIRVQAETKAVVVVAKQKLLADVLLFVLM
jgi:hypothetical protein